MRPSEKEVQPWSGEEDLEPVRPRAGRGELMYEGGETTCPILRAGPQDED